MRLIVILSWAMFVGACFLPALILKNTPGGEVLVWSGSECAIRGLMAFIIGHFEAVANIFFLIASILLLTRFKKASALCSVLALAFAFQTFSLFSTRIYMDEGGVNIANLTGFGPGFYLWFGSMLIVALASFVRLFWSKDQSAAAAFSSSSSSSPAR